MRCKYDANLHYKLNKLLFAPQVHKYDLQQSVKRSLCNFLRLTVFSFSFKIRLTHTQST